MKAFKLDEHPKIDTGFTTPENYFELLSENVNIKIATDQPKVISINRRKTWMYSVAAVLVVGLGITVFNALSVQSTLTDSAAIENYLAYQPNTEELLVEVLENGDIENLSASYNLDDQAVEELLATNTNLENYIIN